MKTKFKRVSRRTLSMVLCVLMVFSTMIVGTLTTANADSSNLTAITDSDLLDVLQSDYVQVYIGECNNWNTASSYKTYYLKNSSGTAVANATRASDYGGYLQYIYYVPIEEALPAGSSGTYYFSNSDSWEGNAITRSLSGLDLYFGSSDWGNCSGSCGTNTYYVASTTASLPTTAQTVTEGSTIDVTATITKGYYDLGYSGAYLPLYMEYYAEDSSGNVYNVGTNTSTASSSSYTTTLSGVADLPTGTYTIYGTLTDGTIYAKATNTFTLTVGTPTYYIEGRFGVRDSENGSFIYTGTSAGSWNVSSTNIAFESTEIENLYKLDTYCTLAELSDTTNNTQYFRIGYGDASSISGTYQYNGSDDVEFNDSVTSADFSSTSSDKGGYFSSTDTSGYVTIYFNSDTKEVYYTLTSTDHTVTVTAGEGGTVTVGTDPEVEVEAGGTGEVTINSTTSITATPTYTADDPASDGSYYVFKEWTVTDGVTVADTTSASTTMTATADGGTVTATFTEISGEAHDITYEYDESEVDVSYTTTTTTYGTEVTITASAVESDYSAVVTVVDDQGNSLDVTDNGNGTFTFTMPDTTVTVTITATEVYDDYAITSGWDWYNDDDVSDYDKTLIPVKTFQVYDTGTSNTALVDYNHYTSSGSNIGSYSGVSTLYVKLTVTPGFVLYDIEIQNANTGAVLSTRKTGQLTHDSEDSSSGISATLEGGYSTENQYYFTDSWTISGLDGYSDGAPLKLVAHVQRANYYMHSQEIDGWSTDGIKLETSSDGYYSYFTFSKSDTYYTSVDNDECSYGTSGSKYNNIYDEDDTQLTDNESYYITGDPDMSTTEHLEYKITCGYGWDRYGAVELDFNQVINFFNNTNIEQYYRATTTNGRDVENIVLADECYVIVYYPNTEYNSTDYCVVCASTVLPYDIEYIADVVTADESLGTVTTVYDTEVASSTTPIFTKDADEEYYQTITANPIGNATFVGWTTTTSNIIISDPSSATTTVYLKSGFFQSDATVSVGTITANFLAADQTVLYLTYNFTDYDTSDGNFVYEKGHDKSETETYETFVTFDTDDWNEDLAKDYLVQCQPIIQSNYYDYTLTDDNLAAAKITAPGSTNAATSAAYAEVDLDNTAHLYTVTIDGEQKYGYYNWLIELESTDYVDADSVYWTATDQMGNETVKCVDNYYPHYITGDATIECKANVDKEFTDDSVVSNTYYQLSYSGTTQKITQNFYIVDHINIYGDTAYDNDGNEVTIDTGTSIELLGGGVVYFSNDNTTATSTFTSAGNVQSYVKDMLDSNYNTTVDATYDKTNGCVFRYLAAVDDTDGNTFRYSDMILAYHYVYGATFTNSSSNASTDMTLYSFFVYSYVYGGETYYTISVSETPATATMYEASTTANS